MIPSATSAIPVISSDIPSHGESSQPGDPLHHQSEPPPVSETVTQPGLNHIHLNKFKLIHANAGIAFTIFFIIFWSC